MSNVAQGTIEYLVIIAIVVVISLVVVGMSLGAVGSPSEQISVSSSAIKSSIGVGGISVSDGVAGLDGNGLLVLKGPIEDTLAISKINVDGVDHNYSVSLCNGEVKSFKLKGVSSCSSGVKSYSVKVVYTSSSGLEKTADFQDLKLSCVVDVQNSNSGNVPIVDEYVVHSVFYISNDSQGGSVPVDSEVYASGASVTVLDNSGSLVKTGYVFNGWNTSQDGSGVSYTPGNTFAMGSSDLNLYVQWREPITTSVTLGPNMDEFCSAGFCSDGGWNWVDNIETDNDNYSYINGYSGTYVTGYIHAKNFGFDIPSNAVINGFLVVIKKNATLNPYVRDNEVKLIKSDGSLGSENKADTVNYWLTTKETKSYGSNSSLWGETWLPENINDSDFGVALRANVTNPAGVKIYYVQITVYYTY